MTQYTEEVSRRSPTLFLFLVDQSGSMSLPFAGQSNRRMSDGVADAINRLVFELVTRCSRGNEIFDYYYIGLVGYNSEINFGFGGALQGKPIVAVSEVGNNPIRIETRTKKTDDGAGGVLVQKAKFPVWLDPVAKGKTRMCEALRIATKSVQDFVANFPDSHPPLDLACSRGGGSWNTPHPE